MTLEEWKNDFKGFINELSMPKDDYNGIMEYIDEVPNEPMWIPISKKLPEDGQSVLFCDIDGDIMIGYHVKGRHDTHFSQAGTFEDIKNVRAWMPLPKPYEPQESDHKCHTCKHYTSGEYDGSCGSYICKGYSNWESEDKE